MWEITEMGELAARLAEAPMRYLPERALLLGDAPDVTRRAWLAPGGGFALAWRRPAGPDWILTSARTRLQMDALIHDIPYRAETRFIFTENVARQLERFRFDLAGMKLYEWLAAPDAPPETEAEITRLDRAPVFLEGLGEALSPQRFPWPETPGDALHFVLHEDAQPAACLTCRRRLADVWDVDRLLIGHADTPALAALLSRAAAAVRLTDGRLIISRVPLDHPLLSRAARHARFAPLRTETELYRPLQPA